VKLSTIKFAPNNLERDAVIRVAGPEGRWAIRSAKSNPSRRFGGEAVIEGMY
jgi:hypothetical protein